MSERLIHRIWIGGEEPDWTRSFANTWARPGWELVQWNDSDVEDLFPLRNQKLYDRAPVLAPRHVGQLRSDVLRYEILHRHGGVYVDADFECLRPVDALLPADGCFVLWEETGRWVCNGLMGAPPEHPFLDLLISSLPQNADRQRGSKPNRLSGPQYLTRMWREHGQAVTALAQQTFLPFSYRDVAENLPGTFDPLERYPDAVAIHWWGNRLRERGMTPA